MFGLLGIRQKLKRRCLSHCFVAPVLASEIFFQGQQQNDNHHRIYNGVWKQINGVHNL
jgi:hypothetical protein